MYRPPEWADASEEVQRSVKFEAASVPIGMSSYDSGALSQYQQKRLNQLKVATIDANYKYLADHPEVRQRGLSPWERPRLLTACVFS